MGARVIMVADDLTGAMDAAGPLAASGLSTWVVASVDDCTRQHLAGAQVLSINADTRHCSAEEASRRVQTILRELVDADSEILIKKIDSTLRGNVVVETLAMLEESGRRAAVVVPAFPAQGRTVIEGVVHVRGVPLKYTNFARDALSPPPLDPLDLLFARADPQAHVHRVAAGGAIAIAQDNCRQIFTIDSISDEDLRIVVRALREHLCDTLLVGSAGIAEAVAEVCFEGTQRAAPSPTTDGPLLFVIGSRAEQSTQQVAALVEDGGVQLFVAPNGRVDVDAASRSTASVLVLKATPDAEGREGEAADVARWLADGVAGLLERRSVAAMVATGGDTAIAILQRLAQPALRVMGNLLPGIPFSCIRAAEGDFWFVTKAGGFGARDTLVNIADRLRGTAVEPSVPSAVSNG